ncbi:MAG TPA: AAA family ATPase [Urbifossiella sp.]|nr:AAA family ATPase [Urbifossiella sp.]
MTAQQPIVPPTEAPAAISEISAAPPLQSVTVVVSPRSEEPKPGHLKQWTSLGAILGLAIGLAAAWMYHSKLPGVFESRARLQVTGPSPAGDAETQIAILRSRSVEERAARKLDDYRPYEMPPPKADAARVAFLEQGLSIVPELSSGPGSTLSVAFRGPHRADTPKYLRAIVDAYKEELASRSPKVVDREPAPKASPPPKSSPERNANAERAKLQKELEALSRDDPSTIESRLTADRAAASAAQAKLRNIDRDLALIRATGKSRGDRLATMEELGIKADSPRAAPGAAAADLKTAEDSLKSLQAKKAELGQRLGPEHRDMVALDERIQLARERIAKATPKAPTGPDELDRHRTKLDAERAAIASQAAALATRIATDERLLADVSRLRKRIDAIAVAAPKANAPAPSQEAASNAESPSPTSFAVQAVIPAGDGERISPELYRSLVPGGALGLLGGTGLGLLGGLIAAGRRNPERKRPSPRTPIMTTMVRPAASAVAITSGPRLSIPVFANVPALRGDVPPEKRSGEGWSPLLVAFSRPSSPEAELFRSARRELAQALRNRGHQVVPITSPGPGDGKSLVAANLAISLAQSGKRVILVDCNLNAPKLQELFRLTRLGDSLKSIMAAEVDLRMAVRSCEVPNLFLLPAGRGPMNADDLLSRPKFRELMAELKSSYEFVIIDAPSVEAERQFSAVAGVADGVVLVVRAGADVQSRSDRGKNAVIAAGATVLGAIVSAAPAVVATTAEPKALAPTR